MYRADYANHWTTISVPSEQGYQPVGRRRTGESTSCTSAPGSASDSGREVPLVRNKAENKKTTVVTNRGSEVNNEPPAGLQL